MKLTNEIVIEAAHKLGFDLVGFTKAEPLGKESEYLKEWLDKGYHADLNYMESNYDKRRDISNVFNKAESVISLAVNYYTSHNYSGDADNGKVSRYAWGKDYHLIIWEKLDKFVEQLRKIDSRFDALTYVDTGPVMDKAWAVRSGIGWLGKHTNVITKELGSWIFIATVINNYKFNYNIPIADFCGTCTACIDACPTDAIVEECVVDSNRCISYLTIENKNDIAIEFKGKFDSWLFGCDICQDVCPWNTKFLQESLEKEFQPHENKELNLTEVLNMSSKNFREKFNNSPIKRAKLEGLKRNARFLLK